MSFFLISCDGGGIRVLLTALLLQDLDTRYGIIAKSNGFAGTSTGGLIALGLAAHVPIADIVTLYQSKGQEIFTPNGWLLADKAHAAQPPPQSPQDLVGFVGPGVFSCQYKNDGLINVVQALVGNTTLSQASTYVGVNSAQLCNPQTGSAQFLAVCRRSNEVSMSTRSYRRGFTSLQAMSPVTTRRDAALPPDFTRYKV